jgi:hypothetical protein
MFNHGIKIVIAVVFGLAFCSVANSQPLPQLRISEIFSNADGSVQFVVFEKDGPQSLAGETLTASNGLTEHTYTFPTDVPCFMFFGSCDFADFPPLFLVGTQGFADLNVVKADFVVPNAFLFASGGSVKLGAAQVQYTTLPTDGLDALWTDSQFGDYDDRVGAAALVNNAGASSGFALASGVVPVIEYYNATLDDYFLTAYPYEIQALDVANSAWQRTGYSLTAWPSALSLDHWPPPNLAPVCRIYIGNTHFYSISATECGDLVAKGVTLETAAAFYATLPNTETGVCPVDQTPVYRLWNSHGSSHRYTTQINVFDDMLNRDYVPEGYGPDLVAMCVGGSK